MKHLYINLLGKFSIQCDNNIIEGMESSKAQELFSYLLLHRNRAHSRERLASLLWGDYCTTAQSKKYLRKALWQLQNTLSELTSLSQAELLHIESEWIEFKESENVFLDVAEIEKAYNIISKCPMTNMDEDLLNRLVGAIQYYKGDLLENMYADWCMVERERLKIIYLRLLDHMVEYCELNQMYDMGISYGISILKQDQARECTHHQLMRLYWKSGDRTGAIRQFEWCRTALQAELDIEPSHNTVQLYTELQRNTSDQSKGYPLVSLKTDIAMQDYSRVFSRIDHLRKSLAELEGDVNRTFFAFQESYSEPGIVQ